MGGFYIGITYFYTISGIYGYEKDNEKRIEGNGQGTCIRGCWGDYGIPRFKCQF